MRKDVSYSILLSTGFRVDCKGKRISQAMKNCAKQYPHIVSEMTPSFLTYIHGVSSYGFRQTEESRKTLKSIQKSSFQKEKIMKCPECEEKLETVNVVTLCSRPATVDENGKVVDYEAVDWYGEDTIEIICPHCFSDITSVIKEI